MCLRQHPTRLLVMATSTFLKLRQLPNKKLGGRINFTAEACMKMQTAKNSEIVAEGPLHVQVQVRACFFCSL